MEAIEIKHRQVVEALHSRRSQHKVPNRIPAMAERFAHLAFAALFPHFSSEDHETPEKLDSLIEAVSEVLIEVLSILNYPHPINETVSKFIDKLLGIHHALVLDARAIFHGDPAAESIDEVILAYPGFYAIAMHRIAHELSNFEIPIFPRILAEYAHRRTGIDIHPGATVGRSFFIDHGTGIVIGETAVIGNGVKLYQGVTLGALVVQKHLSSQKRHPTLGDNVVVYANATILGGDTDIGHDTVIGGNAWITESIPPFSIVGRNSEVRKRNPGEESEIEFNI